MERMSETLNGTAGPVAGSAARPLVAVHEPDVELNCRGLSCPLPVLRTRKAMDAMQSGQVLRLVATDPGSVSDMPAWVRQTGHTLVKAEQPPGEYVFYIQKR
jgi:tRNA 2-thiouridine synthesizing protein A